MKRKICSFLLAFLLLLTLTPAALADGAQPSYITDDAGILTASETASLEKAAQHIAQRYGVGIYLVTVNDACRIDSRGTYEAAYTYYHRNSLGAGAERNGAILLLSMNDRAFAHFYYGEKSESPSTATPRSRSRIRSSTTSAKTTGTAAFRTIFPRAGSTLRSRRRDIPCAAARYRRSSFRALREYSSRFSYVPFSSGR